MVLQILVSIAVCVLIGDQQPVQDSIMVDTVFWKSGRVREVRTYDKGVFHYDFISWHANGARHRMGRFEDSDTHVDSSWDWHGTQQVSGGSGPYSEYYENGLPRCTGFYKDRWQDSTWTSFFPNGHISSRGNYGEGSWHAWKEGEWTYWYEDDLIHSKGTYERGVEKGVWSYYHPNGQLIRTMEGGDFMNRGRYEEAVDTSGRRTLEGGVGFLTEYHQNGRPSSVIHVSDFHKDTVMTFYPSGGRRDRMVYMTDSTRNVWWNEGTVLDAWDSTGLQTLNEGSGFQWTASDDGETRSRIRYVAGLKHGDSEQYDQRGRLRELDCYDRGDWTGRVIYFNNGKRYTDFDCFNSPWFWMDEEIHWWYNGKLRRYDNGDSVVEYFPNGQIRCIGFYPSRDSTIKTDPNRDYVLMGSTTGSGSVWGTYKADDWVRSYFPSGSLSSEVIWRDSCACLIRTEFYPSGRPHWIGRVHYGELKLSPTDSDGDTFFTGYHRIGKWEEFDADGHLLQVVDFDARPLDERQIKNYSSPVE